MGKVAFESTLMTPVPGLITTTTSSNITGGTNGLANKGPDLSISKVFSRSKTFLMGNRNNITGNQIKGFSHLIFLNNILKTKNM